MKILFALYLTLSLLPINSLADRQYQHAYAFLSTPKYPADFNHFDYVNPEANKGGVIRLPQMGNWDNLNPITTKGRLAAGLGFWSRDTNLLWDSLMVPALDEPATHYGLLAEGIAVAEDRSWVAFKLRAEARFHDGQAITTEDVEFTFKAIIEHGAPDLKSAFGAFQLEVETTHEFRFLIPAEYRQDPELPIRLGALPILPAHVWTDRGIDKTTVLPILGSGPYEIAEMRVGRWIKFNRIIDYWGAHLAINRGRYNFDEVKFDYFRDDQVQTEAVKANIVDVHVENVPRTWYASYDIPAVSEGYVIKQEYQLAKPAGLWWPIFWNMAQKRFQDWRVRRALWIINDMTWQNTRSYGFWGQATSFFHDSEFAARGLPSEKELVLLNPIKHLVPEQVFSQPYRAQPNSGSGWSRANLLEAASLLKQAGWVVRDNKLVHGETGESFELRLVAVSPALAGSFIPLTRQLAKLGIKASAKSPEISNWLYRMRSGDFDGGAIWFLPNNTPTLQIRNSFHSSEANRDYSANWSNLQDPAIDFLIDAIGTAETWPSYVAAIRAFDRVMLHNYYWLPMMSKTNHAIVYWDKFGIPNHGRLQRLGFLDLWWWNEEKASRVARYAGDDS